MSYFYDRKDAGQKLSKRLEKYSQAKDVVVLGLPRGGIVVAAEVARFLQVPLDVLIVKKMGCPGNPELAMGAVDDQGTVAINEEVIKLAGVSKEEFEKAKNEAWKLAQKRAAQYRKQKRAIELHNKVVVLIDDGLATGATMQAAVAACRKRKASKIIVAVPVAAPDSMVKIQKMVDEVQCLYEPESFGSVGFFYSVFDQTEDDEVLSLIQNT
ncbi:MAG: phosphoribosyltransferase [Deltaproteobacteria bacterium]|nr:phosphoribosyltransferase [Deltaproteobacteria bacterium]